MTAPTPIGGGLPLFTSRLEKLSEKGYEHFSDRGFGRCMEDKMGRKPLSASRRATPCGRIWDFSDSFRRSLLGNLYTALRILMH